MYNVNLVDRASDRIIVIELPRFNIQITQSSLNRLFIEIMHQFNGQFVKVHINHLKESDLKHIHNLRQIN